MRKPGAALIQWVILGAGQSVRFGSHKLLAETHRGRLIGHVLSSFEEAGANPTLVIRAEDLALYSYCRKEYPSLTLATCPDSIATQGMGHTLAWAARNQWPADCEWMGVALADMPDLQPMTLRLLLEAIHADATSDIIAPTYLGRPGHPVLFRRNLGSSLVRLSGDRGARSILQSSANSRLVDVNDPGIHRDIDTRTDWLNWQKSVRKGTL